MLAPVWPLPMRLGLFEPFGRFGERIIQNNCVAIVYDWQLARCNRDTGLYISLESVAPNSEQKLL